MWKWYLKENAHLCEDLLGDAPTGCLRPLSQRLKGISIGDLVRNAE